MKKFIKIILLILLILIIVGIGLIFYLKNKYNKTYKEVKTENLGIENEELTGYRNIVILGVDSDENDYEGERRSDCIIIVSINQETKDIKLVSVYRDTYLNIEEKGLDKVTHAYSYGQEEKSIKTLNENLDLDIAEYVTINFEAVRKIVDSIGGVEVTVTEKEATQINGINSAGTYNLSGAQALQYGRIRKIDNDYVRTERMRTVLIATFEKVKTMKKTELISLINSLLPEVQTNIELSDLIKLVSNAEEYNVTLNIGWPYEVKGITLDRWYAVPVTLEKNVMRLHKELFEEENYEATEKVKEYSKNVIDKTGYR